ncbi:baculoviral IAP repeat-containing protein 5-like [Melospiza melodia melodia]|uniref:baculoviral IAP repeat-containing protein 5-like n=1 Tax=Melospiza georgiana TaxID=44398 RepID=UPI0025AB82C2|nr:baculoviral IAP repeat-containing protein 5-like [Melospiza georgiana]
MAGPELLPEVWRLYFHSVRAATFHNWPFTEGCACTPERMAAAGFVHCPSENSPDVAQCFYCLKELEGWEPDDDPLEEHKKHSAACGFLSLQKEPSNLTVQEFLKLEKMRTRKALKKEVSQMMTKVEDKAKIQRCRIKNLV